MKIFPSQKLNNSPYGFYSLMRRLHPVANDEESSTWGIFRYHDIRYILANPSIFSSNPELSSKSQYQDKELLDLRLLYSDPPIHGKLRDLISFAFTPDMILRLKPQMEKMLVSRMDQIIQNGH